MLRACVVCGKPSDQGRCPEHRRDPNATRNPTRDLAQHQRWATAVKQRDGYRCRRCGSTDKLDAHHVRLGWDLEAGLTLCNSCHCLIDPHARPR